MNDDQDTILDEDDAVTAVVADDEAPEVSEEDMPVGFAAVEDGEELKGEFDEFAAKFDAEDDDYLALDAEYDEESDEDEDEDDEDEDDDLDEDEDDDEDDEDEDDDLEEDEEPTEDEIM